MRSRLLGMPLWVSAMIATGIALASAGIAAPSAHAQESVAASCPGPREVGFISVSPGARFAQTFSPSVSGSLTKAQIVVQTSGTDGDYIVSINAVDGAGTPTNTVLAITTVPDSFPGEVLTTIEAVFPSAAVVAAGQTYGLVISRPASNELQVGGRQGNDCGGTLFASSSSSGSFSTSGAGSNDLVFSVFVAPPPTPEPAPQDSTAPTAKITEGPKDKTKKKTATFQFTGADARAVAGFECRLDDEAFRACSSPITYKVKRGRHTFEVRAVDDSGNVGAVVSDAWKVKKKRR